MSGANNGQLPPLLTARFAIGQVIRHALFGYSGVVFDVDAEFAGSDAWYEQVARSRPPKDEPWYHILPHGAEHTTYVAERNLAAHPAPDEISHPLLDALFENYDPARACYQPRAAN